MYFLFYFAKDIKRKTISSDYICLSLCYKK